MSLGELVPLDELEAVNVMLGAIGESPVSSLDTVTSSDVSLAKKFLLQTSREVQGKGLHSNTEKNYRISPNVGGEIVLPTNTLRVDEVIPQGEYNRDLTERGGKLYDRVNHTYAVGEAVYVDLVRFLSFDELPSATRNFITIRAARRFQDKILGDEALHTYDSQDEALAKSDFKKAELSTKDLNYFRNNHGRRILDRRSYKSLRGQYL